MGNAIGKDADNDRDDNSGSRYDSDDQAILNFGRRPSVTEEETIATLVKHYYLDAAAADGVAACTLIYSLTAESFAEENGQLAGPSGLRPGACARVVSKLFEQQHQHFVHAAKTLQVVRVRVEGNLGMALLSFGSGPWRMLLRREGGAWKVTVLSEVAVP